MGGPEAALVEASLEAAPAACHAGEGLLGGQEAVPEAAHPAAPHSPPPPPGMLGDFNSYYVWNPTQKLTTIPFCIRTNTMKTIDFITTAPTPFYHYLPTHN